MTGSSQYPPFIGSEIEGETSVECFFHVIPVPFERSVSYGAGTAAGPRAILEASQQLESFDGRSMPLERGIHTTEPVDCSGTVEQVIDNIRHAVSGVLSAGKVPVLLGGEHTVTLGALHALADHARQPFGIFQLDAHADLRDSYEGSRFSHACVARRAHQDLGLPLFQFGVRALSREEDDYRRSAGVGYLDARSFQRDGLAGVVMPTDFPDALYLTLDVDGLDPSVIRSTGTPVPGGPGWYDTLDVLENVLHNRTVLGFDVVELAPREDDHASSFAAAMLVYTVMGIIQRCCSLP